MNRQILSGKGKSSVFNARSRSFAALLVLLSLMAPGCSPGKPPFPPPPAAENPSLSGLVLIPARSPGEKTLGLQHVTALPDDTGVLFFIDQPRANRVFFHSKNCLFVIGMTALDASGKILVIDDLPPESAISFPAETAFVIETEAGWFPARGFRPGGRLNLDELGGAVDESLNVIDDLPRKRIIPAGEEEGK